MKRPLLEVEHPPIPGEDVLANAAPQDRERGAATEESDFDGNGTAKRRHPAGKNRVIYSRHVALPAQGGPAVLASGAAALSQLRRRADLRVLAPHAALLPTLRIAHGAR